MQVIGLCRFSYPAVGGFQVEHDTIEDRIAYLYGVQRMEERFRLFEAITLPALKAQIDPEFTLIVLVGDSLPATYAARLQDLCASVPQIQIRAEAPARHRPIMRKVLNEARKDISTPCLQFRLDDDDAIAVDFVSELRDAAQDCKGLLRRHSNVAFDFNTGFLARVRSGVLETTEEVTRPYQTAGLGVYVAGGEEKSVMNFSHHQIMRHIPTVTLNTPAMFLRSHNQFNDSRQSNAHREEMKPITRALRRIIRHRFAIGEDQITQLCGSGVRASD